MMDREDPSSVGLGTMCIGEPALSHPKVFLGPKGSRCSRLTMLLLVLWHQVLMLEVVFREHMRNHRHHHQQMATTLVADKHCSCFRIRTYS